MRPLQSFAAAALAVALVLVACSPARAAAKTAAAPIAGAARAAIAPPAAGTEEAAPAVAAAVAARKDAEERVKQAERQLVTARLDVAAAREDERAARTEARLAPLRRIAAVVEATCLLGLLAAVALWFILPVGLKRWAWIVGGACLGVLCLALFVSALLPYLWIVGGFLTLAGVTWGLWHLWRTQLAAGHAAAHADRLEEAVKTWGGATVDDLHDVISQVKAVSARAQQEAGVRGILAAIRGKPQPAAPAQDPLPQAA